MKNVNGLYRYVRFNKTLDYFLSVICSPSTLLSLEPPIKNADVLLDELVKKYHEGKLKIKVMEFSTKFYDDESFEVFIWTANYPYSYGQVFTHEKLRLNRAALPTRYARILFKRFLDKEGMPSFEPPKQVDINEIMGNIRNLERKS
jgi:hypothetical protein